MSEQVEHAGELAEQALAASLVGDDASRAAALAELADVIEREPKAVLAACYVWAKTASNAMTSMARSLNDAAGPGWIGESGGDADLGATPPTHSPAIWATRFIAAIHSDDRAAIVDLLAESSDNRPGICVVALLDRATELVAAYEQAEIDLSVRPQDREAFDASRDALMYALDGNTTGAIAAIKRLAIAAKEEPTAMFHACWSWAGTAASTLADDGGPGTVIELEVTQIGDLTDADWPTALQPVVETIRLICDADGHIRPEVHGATGVIDPDTVPTDLRPVIWALRFITAVHNDGLENAAALFNAVPDDELFTTVRILLHVAADIAGQVLLGKSS